LDPESLTHPPCPWCGTQDSGGGVQVASSGTQDSGARWLAVGFRWLAVGFRVQVVGFRWLAVGFRWLAVGFRVPVQKIEIRVTPRYGHHANLERYTTENKPTLVPVCHTVWNYINILAHASLIPGACRLRCFVFASFSTSPLFTPGRKGWTREPRDRMPVIRLASRIP